MFALLFLMGTSTERLGLPWVFSSSLALCLSAVPGTKEGTTTSFHLIISFVLKYKNIQGPGRKKKKMEEQGTPPFLGPPVLFSVMVPTPRGAPQKHFVGPSKFIPHHCSKTEALGMSFVHI